MLRLVLVFLMAYLALVILAQCPEKQGTPRVYIDGYAGNKSYACQANLSLGITLVLVCRPGIEHGEKVDEFVWTYPEHGYVDKNISDDVIAINITSEHDSGQYTCNISVGDKKASGSFNLNVTGGEVVHSYGRLILNEEVIFNKRQLLPQDNNDSEADGRIECRVSSGGARFQYYGSESNLAKVNPPIVHSEFNTTVIIKRTDLRRKEAKKFAIEGTCGSIFHYLFLQIDCYCQNLNGSVDVTRSNGTITVTIGTLPEGIKRAIVGYTAKVEGAWMEVEYINLRECDSRSFSMVGNGEKHRITVWGLSGGDTIHRRRCRSPFVHDIGFMSSGPASPPRGVDLTGVGSDAQINWIQPKDPNGYISHFKIKLVQKGLKQEFNTDGNINSHILKGMVKGESYNVTVMAVRRDGSEGESSAMKPYVHLP